MPLTNEQNEEFKNWFESKKRNDYSCPVCGQNGVAPGEIISSPQFSTKGFSIGGPSVPMVQLICTNCGHIILFAAAAIFKF